MTAPKALESASFTIHLPQRPYVERAAPTRQGPLPRRESTARAPGRQAAHREDEVCHRVRLRSATPLNRNRAKSKQSRVHGCVQCMARPFYRLTPFSRWTFMPAYATLLRTKQRPVTVSRHLLALQQLWMEEERRDRSLTKTSHFESLLKSAAIAVAVNHPIETQDWCIRSVERRVAEILSMTTRSRCGAGDRLVADSWQETNRGVEWTVLFARS